MERTLLRYPKSSIHCSRSCRRVIIMFVVNMSDIPLAIDRNSLYSKRAVDTKGVPTYFSGFFSEIVVVPEEANNDIANANDVCCWLW